MPIEFRCLQCGKLLRTADDTAGKQAQCPHCGSVMTIPGAEAATPASPFTADSSNQYQSPGDYAAQPAMAPPGEIAWTTIDFGDVFRRTWTIFQTNWGNCVVAWVIVFAINMALSFGLVFAMTMVGHAVAGHRSEEAFRFVGNVVSNLINVWLGIGLTLYMLKVARGQAAEFSDLFSGGPHFLPILLGSIAFAIMVNLGILLCVVPGVILALMFSQFYYLIVDRRLRVFDAFGTSKALTTGNKLTLFSIWIVYGVVGLLAVVCTCGLGLLAVGPYGSLLIAVIYLAITGQRTADQVVVQPAAESV